MSQKAYEKHGPKAHLICSSGGNAGLAVAYAGRQLGIKATIVVPLTTNEFMKKKIIAEGAEVVVEGEVSEKEKCLTAGHFIYLDQRRLETY